MTKECIYQTLKNANQTQNCSRFVIENDGLYIKNNEDVKIFRGFISKKTLKETRGHYLFIESIHNDGSMIVKYGHALNKSIYDRWDYTGTRGYLDRIIGVWKTNITDKETHRYLKNMSIRSYNGYKKSEKYTKDNEMYEVEGVNGLCNLLIDIEKTHKKQGIGYGQIEYPEYPMYDTQKESVLEIFETLHKGYNVIFCDFPARMGKTKINTEIFKKTENERIMVICSYVGTVLKSYQDEIKSQNNLKIIDVDEYSDKSFGAKKEIENHLEESEKNKVIIYIQLTGDDSENITLFNKRINGIVETCKKYSSFLVIEEADFGSKCSNQIKKLNSFYKKIKPSFNLIVTGTNIESTYGIFKENDGFKCKTIRKNYILDILRDKSRKNVVGINYHRLCNWIIMENIDDYIKEEMENFTHFFSLDKNGKLKGESYLRQVIRFLFNTEKFAMNLSNKDLLRSVIDNKIINDNFATILFTPDKGIKEYAPAFEKLINEELCGEYIVVTINSDITDNRNAEELCIDIIDRNYKNKGNKVIFIMGSMGNRSWSVEEAKNCVLLMDSIGYSSLIQKISRCLTPIKKDHNKKLTGYNMCNVIDFTLKNLNRGHLGEFLSGVANNSILKNIDEKEVIDMVLATDKIHFYEYFRKDSTNPIKKISKEELNMIFRTSEYKLNKAMFIFSDENLKNVSEPKSCYTGADDEIVKCDDLINILNRNIIGDKDKKIYKKDKKHVSNKKNQKEVEEVVLDRKKQHFYFLWNNMNLFKTYEYNDNDNDRGDWLYKEFENIKKDEKLKKQYSKLWNVDMDTIIDFVDLLKNNNYKF